MAAPGRRFSFMRLINNAVPNMARDDPNDVDLSPKQADDLLRYQLLLPCPRYLSEKSFFVAGIVGAESLSKKVYKSLVKHGLILPAPEDAASEQVPLTVNTAGVTRNFASQVAIISVHAQRKLVGLLFFWEEECMRWKLLDEEEREILSVLDSMESGGDQDLALALEAVGMKKTMLPSQRAEGAANVARGTGHELPSYTQGYVSRN